MAQPSVSPGIILESKDITNWQTRCGLQLRSSGQANIRRDVETDLTAGRLADAAQEVKNQLEQRKRDGR
jgi:hypothetical protein